MRTSPYDWKPRRFRVQVDAVTVLVSVIVTLLSVWAVAESIALLRS